MGKWLKRPPERSELRWKAEPGSRLAELRDEAHRAFDVHWQFYDTRAERHRARTKAYRWLARQLGIPFGECHFGMLGIKDCERAIAICRSSSPGE